MRKILPLLMLSSFLIGCRISTSSTPDLSSLDCVLRNNYQCKKICTDAGGKLSAGSMTLTGPTNFRCTFPANDAGKTCTNSDQCELSCTLTYSQLDTLGIPHLDGKNTFGMNGSLINLHDGQAHGSARQSITLPTTMDQDGTCLDYGIESFTGAYELNNGTATLIQGSQAVN